MPDALAQLLREVPLSAGKVEFAWKSAVGPALERVSEVRLEGRLLIVEAATAQWTREIVRMAGLILPRVQSLLGRETVERIVVRQLPTSARHTLDPQCPASSPKPPL